MYIMGSTDEALRELREISAKYDRIQTELDEINRELDKPITGHS